MDEVLDDDELRVCVERARLHDPDAWEQLYRHGYRRLHSYARRRLPTADAAEDAISDGFIRAMERVDSFTWKGIGWDGWMYGIVRNIVLESLRRTDRDTELQRREAAMVELRPGATPIEPSSVVVELEEAARLRAAFGTLDADDQEVLELRFVGGLTAEETGQVIGKSSGAVRMAQSRAIERLRVELEEPRHVR